MPPGVHHVVDVTVRLLYLPLSLCTRVQQKDIRAVDRGNGDTKAWTPLGSDGAPSNSSIDLVHVNL